LNRYLMKSMRLDLGSVRNWSTLRRLSSSLLLRRGWKFYQAGKFDQANLAFRLASAISQDAATGERLTLHVQKAQGRDVTTLSHVILGTIGLCNASCIHCPTGKASTAHVPRTPMPMDTFEKIVSGIAQEKMLITEHLAFGLFGDGLVDPHVVARAHMVRRYLPDVRLMINTNGAAFDPVRHQPLADLVEGVTLHCESLQEERYNQLMAPLRLKNVLSKFERILSTFQDVQVSVPVTRVNRDEISDIAAWFYARGAKSVHFDPLASRCAEDTTVFDALALDPQQIACTPDILDSLIIDCDGTALACCQDFQRIQRLGDLMSGTLADALDDPRRAEMGRKLAEGCHSDIATCQRCRGDVRTPDFPFDQVQ